METSRQLVSGGFPEHGSQWMWSVVSGRIVNGTLFPHASLTLRASQGQGRREACGVKGSLTEVWSSQGGGFRLCSCEYLVRRVSPSPDSGVPEGRRGKTSLTAGSWAASRSP